MSEGIRPEGRRRRRLTTGHHTIDYWAGLTPVAIAAMGFLAAWHFDTFSGVGIFLRLMGFVLALLGLVIVGLRVHVTNHRDYYGGLALLFLALVAFWAGADLAGLRGFQFGAGTAPRLFAGSLAVVATAITVTGLVTDGAPIGGYAVRGPLYVTLAILSFAFLIRGFTVEWGGKLIRVPAFGLLIAAFVTFMIAAAASKESRPIEAAAMAVALTAFCWFVFVYVLGLPFQLWPRF
jgi:hypothetical protein